MVERMHAETLCNNALEGKISDVQARLRKQYQATARRDDIISALEKRGGCPIRATIWLNLIQLSKKINDTGVGPDAPRSCSPPKPPLDAARSWRDAALRGGGSGSSPAARGRLSAGAGGLLPPVPVRRPPGGRSPPGGDRLRAAAGRKRTAWEEEEEEEEDGWASSSSAGEEGGRGAGAYRRVAGAAAGSNGLKHLQQAYDSVRKRYKAATAGAAGLAGLAAAAARSPPRGGGGAVPPGGASPARLEAEEQVGRMLAAGAAAAARGEAVARKAAQLLQAADAYRRLDAAVPKGQQQPGAHPHLDEQLVDDLLQGWQERRGAVLAGLGLPRLADPAVHLALEGVARAVGAVPLEHRKAGGAVPLAEALCQFEVFLAEDVRAMGGGKAKAELERAPAAAAAAAAGSWCARCRRRCGRWPGAAGTSLVTSWQK